MEEVTQIQVTKKTRERIQNFCKKGQSYDNFINKLLDEFEKNKD